jgi:formate dehydrogenase subunit beta
MRNKMVLASSTDKVIFDKGEYGGAVTSLLKYALESQLVDAVLALKPRNGNRYDGVPVLVTESEELLCTSGSLHFASPNIARFIKEYLDGVPDRRIAVTCKPCDAKSIIELAKREQIHRENLILVGLNCTGTFMPEKARKMIIEEFEVDPEDVVREDIDEGVLKIYLKDGIELARDLYSLELKGYGRRENCRRCDTCIPTMADLACGKWGAGDENKTFIEILSVKGSDLIEGALMNDYITYEEPEQTSINAREKKKEDSIKRALRWQKRDFSQLKQSNPEDRLSYWVRQFNQCIKCFGCRDACPICYCNDCYLEADNGIVAGGEVPPNILFPLTRIAHVMDSCVNCGQCQDACPMEIPISLFTFMLNKEISEVFDYNPGEDIESIPPLRSPATDQELGIKEINLSLLHKSKIS